MKTLHCLELVYRENYLNLAKISVLRLFKMAANQCSRLGQKSVIRFVLAKKRKPCKFIEECVMCTEKHVLVKKCLQIVRVCI